MTQDVQATYLAGRTSMGYLMVGIDPSDETGLALYDRFAEALYQVMSLSFWEAVRLLSDREASLVLAVIEDSRGLPMYARHRKRQMTREARDRLCRHVGGMDRDCTLWKAWLEVMGMPVLMVEPSRQKKWDAARLAQITGWKVPTNQHGRDAVRLAWGRSVPRTANYMTHVESD